MTRTVTDFIVIAGTLLVGIICEYLLSVANISVLMLRVCLLTTVNTYLYGLVSYQFAAYYNASK